MNSDEKNTRRPYQSAALCALAALWLAACGGGDDGAAVGTPSGGGQIAPAPAPAASAPAPAASAPAPAASAPAPAASAPAPAPAIR